MFRQRQSRADRVRHEASALASRGFARGRHSAEALREALPDATDVLAELRHQAEPVLAATREQAEPVLKAVREKAASAPVPQRKRSRSKKPFVFLALAIVGAVIAYMLLSKRDEDPAYLMHEPDEPDASPAIPPTPDASVNGSAPSDGPAVTTSLSGTDDDDAATEEVDVPERVSALMAGEPAQPSPTSSPAHAPSPSMASVTRAVSETPAVGPTSGSYAPRAQVAAWDLPSSSIPPMRGQTSL